MSLVAAASTARGDDNVRLYVDGECPGTAGVSAALDAEAIATTDAAAPWTIKVESADGAARLTVLHETAGRVAERATASDDCDAVAEVFALIVKGLLVVPQPAPPSPEPPPAEDEGHVRDSASAGVGDFRGPGAVEPSVRTSVEPVPDSRRRWSFGAAGGLDLGFDDTRARFIELEATFAVRKSAGVRVVLDLGEHVSQPGFATIDRRQSALRAELETGARRGPLWLTVGAGGGLSVSTVGVPSDDGHPVVTRLHPVMSSTLMLGANATRSISVRAHLGLSIFPVTDRYVTATMGEIARSPRATLSFGVGLRFDVGK